MKSKDIFSLAIRLVGLFFIYLAVRVVPVIFSGPPARILLESILSAAVFVVVGWWMLGGASLLMERAYPSGSGQHCSPEVSGPATAKVDA
jgi:hypothetical protein